MPTIQAQAQDYVDGLVKPVGSLGRLEQLAVQLASIKNTVPPKVEKLHVQVFVGDHGVASSNVSAFPQQVTAAMLQMLAQGRAVVTCFAKSAGATVDVVNVGLTTEDGTCPLPEVDSSFVTVHQTPIRAGTRNIVDETAMDISDCERALEAGRLAARRANENGVDVMAIGEVGIANTTSAAAITAQLCGLTPEQVVGRGTGIDDAGLERKRAVVSQALARHERLPECNLPMTVLRSLGGLEVAAMAGCMLECVRLGIPIVLDGFIASSAALVAFTMDSRVRTLLIPSTLSEETGHKYILDRLDCGTPLLDWGLRLGEASGAALCLPLIKTAARLFTDVASLKEVTAPSSSM